tara:strand:- start:13809 stop:14750 length:942 start_codon:yes stop_codon:yes gene_type:complete
MNKTWKTFLNDSKNYDLSSFIVKKELNPKFWSNNNELDPEIREKLLEIAVEFFNSLEVEGIQLDDITLTGSLSNYNWSEFSDVDLHILVDFDSLNIDIDTLKDYFRAKQTVWNKKHDIMIRGHEVEIYVQDTNEPHAATAVYSILNDDWDIEPSQVDPKIDFKSINAKANFLMAEIDKACEMYCDKEYQKTIVYVEKMREKLKKFRKAGLDTGGEFSVENLSFKVLRRNGYLKKLSDLATKAFDKAMSMDGNYKEHWKKFQEELEEDYQQAVKSKHSSGKKELIGGGEEPNSAPYVKKPSYKRGNPPVGYAGS